MAVTRKRRRPTYLVERDGLLYVRIPYPNDKRRRAERRVREGEDVAQVYLALKNDIAAKLAQPPQQPLTVGELLRYYTKNYKPIPQWYQDPITQTAAVWQDERGKLVEGKFADVPLAVLDSTAGYELLHAFKQARAAVKRAIIKKVSTVNAITGRPAIRREVIPTDRKPATINREVEILRRLLVYAQRRRWISHNPFFDGPPLLLKSDEEKRDRIPTPTEEKAILAHCVDDRAHLRGILIAAAETGLRRKWLLKLRWPMVRFEEQPDGQSWPVLLDLAVLQKEQKRNKLFPRFLGITERLRVELVRLHAEWLDERACEQERDDRLFPFVGNKRAYQTACKLAGVTDLQFRDWRHGFATTAIKAGVAKPLAMKMVGHVNEETFDIYLNVDADIARQVAEQMDRARQQLPSEQPSPARSD